tara:strand:+ start:16 stop:768 length:753 start_codon:yes stop_codon:yes gene_type:complete
MKQNINLHIGYHKTGTSSFQDKLSSWHIGIKYFDRNDNLILKLVESVVLNHKNLIEKYTTELKNIIVSCGVKNNLISNENFLRPLQSSYDGLNYFLSLLQNDFEIKVFVSIRNKPELLLSRFKHDLMIIPKWGKLGKYVPLFVIKQMLDYVICKAGECSYPFCSTADCKCGYLKKIPLNFYDLDYISNKLCVPITTCDLLSEDNKASLELVFNNSTIFPLAKLNKTQHKISSKKNEILLKKINQRLMNNK